jgi:hypothetical protein
MKRLTVSSLVLLLAMGICGSADAQQPAKAPQSAQVRMEKDLLGPKAVPANAYYVVQTAGARSKTSRFQTCPSATTRNSLKATR